MNPEDPNVRPASPLWVRGLQTVLMGLAYQLTSTLLLVVAIIQFIWVLLNGGPNARLMALGRSLGLYLGQIARFVSFDSERVPFPFSDWPEDARDQPPG